MVRLAFLVLILLALATGAWALWAEEGIGRDLAINLLAGWVSAIVTAGLIERIISAAERRRVRPLQVSAYEEIAVWLNRLGDFFSSMYRDSAKAAAEVIVVDLLAMDAFDEIYAYLDLDAEAPTFPKMTWAQYYAQSLRQSRDEAAKILDRYVGLLDPRVYRLVHEVRDASFLQPLIAAIREVHKTMGIGTSPFLISYAAPPKDRDLANLRELLAWCAREHARLGDEAKRPINGWVQRINSTELPGEHRLPEAVAQQAVEAIRERKRARDAREA